MVSLQKIGIKGSPLVILSLVNSYCLPVLLYEIETISASTTMRNYLNNAFRTVFAKLFNSFDNNVIANCQYFCGVLPLSYIIDNRSIEFFKRLTNSSNELIKLHFIRSGGKQLEQLLKCYKLPVTATSNMFNLKSALWTHFANAVDM